VLRLSTVAVSLLALLAAGTPVSAGTTAFLEPVATGYDHPLYVTNAGDSRLFVVEQKGKIKIVGGGTFLDLSSRVSQGLGEQGLLGLAFHPNYATNRLFYVNYTRASDGQTMVVEYKRSLNDANTADPASRRVVLSIPQPYANHNGGWMGFKDGNLFISTGDGGSSGGVGDPANRAQSKSSLLGKILRINPLDPDGNGPKTYSVPSTNPFVGAPGLNPIWSKGLRNPWRCSHDRVTGDLWCADVGQSNYEEINHSSTGRKVNYGWRLLEGKHYYNYPGRPAGDLCTTDCKTLPIAEYAHSAFGGGNCAVTGGYVSRRPGAALNGNYIFGDYCSGKIWVISAGFAGGSLPQPVVDTEFGITSFGEGADGRIYVVYQGGAVKRVIDS